MKDQSTTGVPVEPQVMDRQAAEKPISAAAAATQAKNAIAQDSELLSEFVLEAREHLSTIESKLLGIEQGGSQAEAVQYLFRGYHTIKGLAGFLELQEIQEVCHEIETLLDMARTSGMEITPKIIDALLESADYLRQEIDRVEASLHGRALEINADNRSLLRLFQSLVESNSTPAIVEPAQEPALAAPPVLSFEVEAATPPVVAPVVESRPVSAPLPAPAKAVAAPSRKPSRRDGKGETSGETKGQENRLLKVDTYKLDHLVDMVGEMVVAQSLLSHDSGVTTGGNLALARNLGNLARITKELQKAAMAMRMVPVGHLFQRMERLVRDLSRKSGKPIQFETTGDDIELDRNIVEELADPLMHMIRNAIDHGVESPAERKASGKNLTARVALAASHQGSQIVIAVVDDGKGLNREKILNKAVDKGLVEKGAALTDQEVYALIFEAGFSTAEQVTDLSGRGVGMDVVRKQIHKLRGRIETNSTTGLGTTFNLKLPLTLAIINGLVVGVGDERYIMPLSSVKEVFRPTPQMVSTVENKAEMAIVREALFPIVRLHQCFRITPRSQNLLDGLLILIESHERTFCVWVDELIGKQEVVIKSLGEKFRDIPGIAGGAVLGDGRVGLILDVEGISGRMRNA